MVKNPFLLLESYQKKHKDRYFGRAKETAQLYNCVHASNLIMVYGASGTGKTSLINCGLANQFHDTDWLPVFVRRGNDLNVSLHKEIDRLLEGHVPEESVEAKIQRIYRSYFRPIYLIFDQFEELYIMGSKNEQDRFHETVKKLLRLGSQCKILLVIREEYLASLNEFEKKLPSLFDNRLRIEKMNNLNLSKVIVGTTRVGGIDITDPRITVPAILDNLRDKREGVDLTNLQVYMDRLWQRDIKRQKEKGVNDVDKVTFDPELIALVGPMKNVLSDFLDEQMEEVEKGLKKRGVKHAKGLPLEVLFTLVTEDGTKRNMSPGQILEDLPRNRKISDADLDFCLSEFERIRLLRALVED